MSQASTFDSRPSTLDPRPKDRLEARPVVRRTAAESHLKHVAVACPGRPGAAVRDGNAAMELRHRKLAFRGGRCPSQDLGLGTSHLFRPLRVSLLLTLHFSMPTRTLLPQSADPPTARLRRHRHHPRARLPADRSTPPGPVPRPIRRTQRAPLVRRIWCGVVMGHEEVGRRSLGDGRAIGNDNEVDRQDGGMNRSAKRIGVLCMHRDRMVGESR